MNLVIDIGNTRLKAALFKNNELIRQIATSGISSDFKFFFEKHASLINKCIISSVKTIPSELSELLSISKKEVLILDINTPLPFKNLYDTKDTLGKDRLAAVAGAQHMHPGKNILIIDAGTAITYDLLNSDGEYLGGNISPGITMRFKALHKFTANLPMLKSVKEIQLIGTSTNQAITNGVQYGAVLELDGYLEAMHNKFPELVVILTGGDSHFFDNKLKKPIFVLSNLTLLGLNIILQYNAEKY